MKHLKPRPDGRYCAWYKGKQFVARSEREAIKLRDEYKYQCEHGIDEIKPITVREFAEDWLPSAKASVSAKCYNDYAKQLDKLVEACGDKLMNSVTPSDIKKVWKGFVGMSDSIIHRARMIYISMFKAGMESGYCRKNPAEADTAQPHKGTAGTHRAITDEERNLIETVPHRVQAAAMVMLYAGLRRGEMLALTDKDIKDGHIIVNKAVIFTHNQPVVTSTKTDKSNREVPVLDKLKPFLEDIHGYILPTTSGKMCSDVAFRRAWDSYMHALTQAAGHTINIRPHDLRHSYATYLRDHGIDLHIAILLMGHSDEKMILRIYDHVSKDRINNAMAVLNNTNTIQSETPAV